jgi:hypothetical protein
MALRRRGLLAVAVAASLTMLLSACVPRTSFNLGVMPAPFGSLRFLFVHCEDAGITGVSLSTARAPRAGTRPLWRIRSDPPSAASIFTVGRTPLGFSEDVSLRRELPTSRRLFAQVETTAGRYALGFRALDLVPGLVQRPADRVTKEAFAAGACG